MEQQGILSIDATSSLVRAVLAVGKGAEIVVEEALSIDATEWWNSLFHKPSSTMQDPEEDNASPQEASTPSDPEPEKNVQVPFPIDKILRKLQAQSWEESLIILPPYRAVTLHLELPFSQKKSLSRIAPLEAQDKLPFSVTPFHCHAHPVRKISSKLFDIQVDLYPDSLLSNIMTSCKEAQFEPTVVTIPPGLGELCHSLYPKYIRENSFLIFRSALNYSATVLVEGKPVGYFSIPLEDEEGYSDQQFPGEGLLNVWITSIEQKFSCEIERIYFVGESEYFTAWEGTLALRQVEHLNFEDLLPNCSEPALGISTLAATALSGAKQEVITPNYRTGKYLFRPEIRNLMEGFRTLVKPLLLVLLAIAVITPIRYIARQHRIESLEEDFHTIVDESFPKDAIVKGQELPTVQLKLQNSRTMLEQLGTGGKVAPHKEFAHLLQMLKKYSQLKITKLNIRPESTVVDGTAASYGDAEAIENQFKKDALYCDITLNTDGRSRVGKQGFKLTLKKECAS